MKFKKPKPLKRPSHLLTWGDVPPWMAETLSETLFQGELMHCVICGATEHSHPDKKTDWRALRVDGATWYACPREFPPDTASKEEFAQAYKTVLTAIIRKKQSQ